MPCLSRVVSLLLAALVAVAFLVGNFDLAAQDKKDKDKKQEVKDKKPDDKDKKEVKDKKPDDKDKKEVKKEPFKPDMAQFEFKFPDKEKSYWVTDIAFGPDGKSVAATYRNNTIIVWDTGVKKDVLTIKAPPMKGLLEYKGLVFANDTIYAGSGHLLKQPDKTKEKDKDKAKEKEKDKDKVKDKDKKEPAKEIPFRAGEIKSWNAKNGTPGKSLLGHSLDVKALAISRDGKQLASGSEDSTIKIWDISAGKDTQTIKGHTDSVTGVSFSPDAKQLVSTSLDRTVRIWDIGGTKELASFKVEREIEAKDAKGKVTKQKELARDFTHAVFTNDGKKVIAVNRDGFIKIYDVEGKKEVQEIKAPDGILALALSSDGTKFATGGYDQTIKIWDVNGKDLRTIKAHLGNVLGLSFSPNSQWIASGSTDGTVKIWSLK